MSVPQYPKKYDGEVIISPRQHFLAEKEHYKDFHAPSSVILCFESYIMTHFKQQKNTIHQAFWTGELIYLNDQNKELALVGNFGIGGPAASQILEILIAAGTKQFIVVGHAGGLQKTNAIGSIILSDKSVRDEGISHHYLPSEQYAYPSSLLTEKLKNRLDIEGINYQIGSSWTIDSMYRETKEEVSHYADQGIATVEMELASLFAVAAFRQVDIASLLVISDYVAFEEWDVQFHASTTTDALFKAIEVAQKVLLNEPSIS